jgi:hypothetical protein
MAERNGGVPAEAQRQILNEMRQMWLNTRFQTETELKIQERLKQALGRDVTEPQRSLTDRLRDVEVAIGVLDEQIAALPAAPALPASAAGE